MKTAVGVALGVGAVAVGGLLWALWPKPAAAATPTTTPPTPPPGPPTPPPVPITLSELDTGRTITLALGQPLIVQLKEVPSTGSTWQNPSATGPLNVLDQGDSSNPAIGGAVIHTYAIAGLAAGSGAFTVNLVGPDGTTINGSFAVQIVVAPTGGNFGQANGMPPGVMPPVQGAQLPQLSALLHHHGLAGTSGRKVGVGAAYGDPVYLLAYSYKASGWWIIWQGWAAFNPGNGYVDYPNTDQYTPMYAAWGRWQTYRVLYQYDPANPQLGWQFVYTGTPSGGEDYNPLPA
jgi:predicted secreted protein